MSADLMFRGVDELAKAVRSGEISARELVQASLDRIDELNPEINAFVDVDHDGALAAAGEVRPGDDRPFAGVPIAIKNNRALRGRKLTFACSLMEDFVAEYDHSVVASLKAAGFIPVGTTNLPEYGILPTTEPRLFGATRNPWDLSRTAGGSSGGSAAAVASGMVPIAHGNDGGGSIRIPAACCGLVGLKPQRGRISLAPELGDNPLVIDGVLTRTVRETAQVLDVLAGYIPGDASWAPPPAEPFAATAAREPGRMRIACTHSAPIDAKVAVTHARAMGETTNLLRELGHTVETVDPPWRMPGLQQTFGAVFAIQIATSIAFSGMVAGREPQLEDMEPMSWELYQLGRTTNSIDAQLALAQLQIAARGLIGWLEDGYDMILTPSLAVPPLPLGSLDTAVENPMDTFEESGLFTPFTPICNAAGLPAISLPLLQDDQGLPLGMQLIGRPADEGRLLALSAEIEAARPWTDRRPDVAGAPT
jgi:amidase